MSPRGPESFSPKENRTYRKHLSDAKERLAQRRAEQAATDAKKTEPGQAPADIQSTLNNIKTMFPDLHDDDQPSEPGDPRISYRPDPLPWEQQQGIVGNDVAIRSVAAMEVIAAKAFELAMERGAQSSPYPGTQRVRRELESGRPYDPRPYHQEEDTPKNRLLMKMVAGVAIFVTALGGTSAGVSYISERNCAGADISLKGGACGFLASFGYLPGVQEIAGGARDIRDIFFGNDTKSGTENTSGNTLPNTQVPEAEPGAHPESLAFNDQFAEGIPLGAVTVDTRVGAAKINYGKKSVDLPMISKRTLEFTARPLLKNGESQELVYATPLTAETTAAGLVVTLKRNEVTVVVGLENEGRIPPKGKDAKEGEYDATGTSSTGFQVSRTSPSGAFAMTFRDKAPLKSSDASANKVNPYAKPSNEQGAKVLAQLFDLKHLMNVTESVLTNKCTDSANASLQATSKMSDNIDKAIEAKIQAWAVANKKRVELHKEGAYAFDTSTVMVQSVAYAGKSGSDAAKAIATELKSAMSAELKDFTAVGTMMTCEANEAFKQ